MTDRETMDDELTAAYAIVEAFLDGEPVDPRALRSAIDAADVRDHLVGVLVLRDGVRMMGPDAWSAHSAERGRPRWRWMAAAAAVIVALTAGYYTGQRASAATAVPQGVETVVTLESMPDAPKPTHVIRLEPGVNWTDGRGGL